MAIKKRSYSPPTTIEYDPNVLENTVTVWSLGTEAHPWANLYLRDETSELNDEVINVYEKISKQVDLPTLPEDYTLGIFLTIDHTSTKEVKPLKWITLNDALCTYPCGTGIVTALNNASAIVSKAKGDEDGYRIKDYYVKNADYTSAAIIEKLKSMAVNAAKYDAVELAKASESDRVLFTDKYVTLRQHSSDMDTKMDKAELEGYAKTDEIKSYISSNYVSSIQHTTDIDSINTDLHTNYVDVTTLSRDYVKLTKLEEEYVPKTLVATIASAGIVQIDESCKALSISSTGVLSILPYSATDTERKDSPGLVKVTSGNGLYYTAENGVWVNNAYNNSNQKGTVWVNTANGLNISLLGELNVNKAGESTLGTVKVKAGNGLNYDSNQISMNVATASSLGTVSIGNNITLNNGKISVEKYAVPVGVILPWGATATAASALPEGFLLCNGQTLNVSDYQDLFNVIGHSYDTTAGDTTFQLPNMCSNGDKTALLGYNTSGNKDTWYLKQEASSSADKYNLGSFTALYIIKYK